MKVTTTPFEGLLIIEPAVFGDSRGYFFEAYNSEAFAKAGIKIQFVQDNQSRSSRGVLRGLHFQKEPFAQTKLIRVLSGVIYDVVVDIRKKESTYGKHFSIELSADNQKHLLIPKGFAHGFQVLSDTADVLYKCDEFYRPEAEGGLAFNDPDLDLVWKLPVEEAIVSDKDRKLPQLRDLK